MNLNALLLEEIGIIYFAEITLVLFSSPDKINFKKAPYLQKLYQHFKITLDLFSSPDKINLKNFKMAPYLQKLYQHFEINLFLFSSPDKVNFKSLPEMAFKIRGLFEINIVRRGEQNKSYFMY